MLSKVNCTERPHIFTSQLLMLQWMVFLFFIQHKAFEYIVAAFPLSVLYTDLEFCLWKGRSLTAESTFPL